MWSCLQSSASVCVAAAVAQVSAVDPRSARPDRGTLRGFGLGGKRDLPRGRGITAWFLSSRGRERPEEEVLQHGGELPGWFLRLRGCAEVPPPLPTFACSSRQGWRSRRMNLIPTGMRQSWAKQRRGSGSAPLRVGRLQPPLQRRYRFPGRGVGTSMVPRGDPGLKGGLRCTGAPSTSR